MAGAITNTNARQIDTRETFDHIRALHRLLPRTDVITANDQPSLANHSIPGRSVAAWWGRGSGISETFQAQAARSAAPSLIWSGITLSKVSAWLWCAWRYPAGSCRQK